MDGNKKTDRIWKISYGVSPDPTKKLTEKTRLFYGKWGGGLTQSIKRLAEKVKENPRKMWSFSTFRQFLIYDSPPYVTYF